MATTTEINPSSLTNRADSAGPGGGTPGSAPGKLPPIITNGFGAKGGAASAKPTQSLPRVDIEPIYTALKASIGEHWATYKDAVSRFVLGFLNQDELCRATQPFIATDPAREHLHNQLLCAILANVVRDAPDTGVASWVSANDKPTSVSKPVTGNAAEQRLKHEVMQLPPRFRHRIKSVKDEPRPPLLHAIALASSHRRIPGSAAPSLAPTITTPHSATHPPTPSAGGLNKDLEIRRRYNAPLVSETRDIPAASVLAERVLPICYEEGLASGAQPPALIGELLGTALEFFVKESLASLLAPARADAPLADPDSASAGASAVGIATAAFKRRVAAEAARAAKRSEAGLLPAELAALAAQAHGRGRAGDLRLAWDLGDAWMTSMMPWQGARLHAADEADEDDELDGDADAGAGDALAMAVDGLDDPPDDMMAIDEADWGWSGGGAGERVELGGLLDDCLAVGG